ncbi:hypothetical protein [Streptomyces sp. NBC_01235]|uniref:hypothetical protein n=1 Tax=Streptomyces sp. NBC_01235 TaxID=2903788 RepID=UPI002E0D144B|nr:hypothetical protein OG289_00225 [Streptomyces sp. NBC_01235]
MAPVFLHHDRRTVFLITVICLALQAFCLIGRLQGQALGNDRPTLGLCLDSRALQPTGRLPLSHLAGLRIPT